MTFDVNVLVRQLREHHVNGKQSVKSIYLPYSFWGLLGGCKVGETADGGGRECPVSFMLGVVWVWYGN